MWGRLVALVSIVAVAAAIAGLVRLPDPGQLRADIAAIGPAAPTVFILLYAAVTLVPLPKNVLTAVAGLLFGLVQGIIVVLLGALLGALAAFGLGRVLGRAAVERITGARVARVEALLNRHGLLAVLGVRLVPVLPFTAINYAAGLTAVRLRDYLIGTALGDNPRHHRLRRPGHLRHVPGIMALSRRRPGPRRTHRRRCGRRPPVPPPHP